LTRHLDNTGRLQCASPAGQNLRVNDLPTYEEGFINSMSQSYRKSKKKKKKKKKKNNFLLKKFKKNKLK
jgi:hypothetical protein